tara:strand:- start:5084 stop:9079 length:3996 start_codon:yes stop_codon:yes gene_type:complete
MAEENTEKEPVTREESNEKPDESPKEEINKSSEEKTSKQEPEKKSEEGSKEKIILRPIDTEMKKSYLDYSMSVIVGRALPDVRDGLKPVHRRVLFTMHEVGLAHNKPFRKSANVVGNCMARYHPHGDMAIYDTLVRMAQDFSLRYPLVDGQGNFGCFTKDTKIALTDGRNLSFDELIKESKKGKKNYTFTINKKGDIDIAEIKNPRLTKKNQRILKIVLDNDNEIKCTLNHKFMLRDGIYKEAKELKSGDSLMPLYLKLSTEKEKFKPALRNYHLVYQPKTDDWITVHSLADAWNLKNSVYEKSSGRIRHHVDFNRLNNNPENIKRIKWKDHWKYHAEHASELHKDKDYRKKIEEGRNKFWSDPDNRRISSERLSKRNKQNWKNPIYRKKMQEFLSRINKEYIKKHPEKRKEFSERATNTLKRLWQDPEYREMKSNSLKEKWKDPKYYKEQSDRMKELSIKIWSNPEHKKNISKLSKDRWKNDSKYRNHVLPILSENGKKANYYRFLTICRKTIESYDNLDEENYEKIRVNYNSRKGAGIVKFSIGLNRFFSDNIGKLYTELGLNVVKLNHKIKDVVLLDEAQDVYDLTIDNTHNFALASGVFVHNSVDGDSAAASRYTEARLSRMAEELLEDINKETVKFVPNYDNSKNEPSVLPSKLPNLLINGSSGIAVGMATNIPPHNLREVAEGTIKVIDNPDVSLNELNQIIKGPDFPTGGVICGRHGIFNAYLKGKGKLLVRAKTSVEDIKGRKAIIVNEIPYQVNKSQMIEHIAELVKDKKVEGIYDLRDESDRTGMRIVIELKQDANEDIVLNQLFKHSRMQTTFGVNTLALVDNAPRILNLKEMISYFIKHRQRVVRKRTEFDLRKAEDRAHILEGLLIALESIDTIIASIKKSKSVLDAKEMLMEEYELSEKQSLAILDLRLQKLTSLEQEKIKTEHKELLKVIAGLKEILASEQKILDIIKEELLYLKQKYGDERRTDIVDMEEELEIEDLIEKEDMVVTITRDGYIKRLPIDTYKQQRRGGKGILATATKEEDIVEDLFVANTLSYILFFTNKGRAHWLKVYVIPEASRQARGKAIVNMLNVDKDEKVTAYIPVESFEKGFIIMGTKKGTVKKTALENFSRPRKGGIIAINLEESDELINVVLTEGSQQILLATKNGMAVKFDEKNVRPTGRSSMGVRGIRLKDKDEVIGMVRSEDNDTLLTLTENGYGKRTKVSEYRLINRGGSGVKNIVCSERNGKVISIKSVTDDDEIFIISRNGVIIRTSAKGISVIGRNTQGVRLMRMSKNDKVVGAAKVLKEEESDDEEEFDKEIKEESSGETLEVVEEEKE